MARKKKTEQENNTDNSNICNDDIDFYFLEFCNIHGIKDIYKVPATQYAAALIYINKKYIKPNRILYKNALQGYKYNIIAIDLLIDKFLYMNYIYNQPLTILNFSLFSGIPYKYIISWKYDNNSISIDLLEGSNIDIYNSLMDVAPGKKRVTYKYRDLYEKLISNQINNADLLAIQKSGVNSIAWSNRVHEKHDKTRDNSKPVFDMLSVADSLGISDKLQGIEGKKGNKVSL